MVRRTENLFHRGPVIRDLSVPDRELTLQPGRLRSKRRRAGRWLRRLYGTALLAWTLGLVAATSGFLHSGGARSSAVPSGGAADVIVPLPDLALPVWADRFREKTTR